MEYIRIWKEVDLAEIKEHIIIVDDTTGFCPNCRKIGIDLKELKKCPSCGREFRYVTSKETIKRNTEFLNRIRKKLPDLVFVDYSDYEHQSGKMKAAELFKKSGDQ